MNKILKAFKILILILLQDFKNLLKIIKKISKIDDKKCLLSLKNMI